MLLRDSWYWYECFLCAVRRYTFGCFAKCDLFCFLFLVFAFVLFSLLVPFHHEIFHGSTFCQKYVKKKGRSDRKILVRWRNNYLFWLSVGSWSLTRINALFFLSVQAYNCPPDWPFHHCPRPGIDEEDETVCCYGENHEHDFLCCEGGLILEWVSIRTIREVVGGGAGPSF